MKPAKLLLLAVLAAVLLLAAHTLLIAPGAAWAAETGDEEKVRRFLQQDEKGVTNANILGITNLNEKSSWAPYAVFDGPVLIRIDIRGLKDDKAVHGALDLPNCISLREVLCPGNLLTRLNLSGCTALEVLGCAGGRLTSLNVSGCKALKTLDCSDNRLASLDVSNCIALESLACNGNQVASLDVSGRAALKELDCAENRLNVLDISDCKALEILRCSQNKLSSLNVTGCALLEELYCGGNQLTALDLSGCALLKELYCGDNKLASLNISDCRALETLFCYNNRLKSLALSGCAMLKALGAHRNPFGDPALAGFKGLALENLSYSDNGDGLTYCVIRGADPAKTFTVKCIGEGFVIGFISGETVDLYINPGEGYQFVEWKDQGLLNLEMKTGYYQVGFDGETVSITAIFGKPAGLSALIIGGIVIVSICGIELTIFALLKFVLRRNSFIKISR